MHAPKRIWWARPRKLCALERPGGGGRSHRPARRETDIGNRHADFIAALCAAHLHQERGLDPVEGLARAAAAGLTVSPAACALVGVDPGAIASAAVAGPG